MRKSFRQPRPVQISRTNNVPAPVKGWNTRDSIAEMDALFAPVLENWWPTGTEISVRKGQATHKTGLPSQVNSLMVYNGFTSSKMFAASSTGIYDVTSSGAVGAAVVAGLTSDKWQYTQFSTLGGLYLIGCNGVDAVVNYDGSSWTNPSITGSGLTSSNFINVNIFKERVFFVEKNTLNAWYLATGAIAGAASKLDFGTVFKRGGYLVAMGTWSLDGGVGLDDHAVFVTSLGEIAVYQGTDPSTATAWSLIGVFQLGTPLGRRCFAKMGGDLIYICTDGVLPLSKALMSARFNNKSALTDTISPTMSQSANSYLSNFGWEVTLYPTENMLLVNVPVSSTTQQQYAMNTITGAWTNFTGFHANCWAILNDQIYFGSNTKVIKGLINNDDDGNTIFADAIQAFSTFGASTQLKRFLMARPIYTTTGTPVVSCGMNIDYDLTSTVFVQSLSSSTVSLWDTAIWDQSIWGGLSIVQKAWQFVSGVGYAAGMRVKAESNQSQINWLSSDYVMEYGGVL